METPAKTNTGAFIPVGLEKLHLGEGEDHEVSSPEAAWLRGRAAHVAAKGRRDTHRLIITNTPAFVREVCEIAGIDFDEFDLPGGIRFQCNNIESTYKRVYVCPKFFTVPCKCLNTPKLARADPAAGNFYYNADELDGDTLPRRETDFSALARRSDSFPWWRPPLLDDLLTDLTGKSSWDELTETETTVATAAFRKYSAVFTCASLVADTEDNDRADPLAAHTIRRLAAFLTNAKISPVLSALKGSSLWQDIVRQPVDSATATAGYATAIQDELDGLASNGRSDAENTQSLTAFFNTQRPLFGSQFVPPRAYTAYWKGLGITDAHAFPEDLTIAAVQSAHAQLLTEARSALLHCKASISTVQNKAFDFYADETAEPAESAESVELGGLLQGHLGGCQGFTAGGAAGVKEGTPHASAAAAAQEPPKPPAEAAQLELQRRELQAERLQLDKDKAQVLEAADRFRTFRRQQVERSASLRSAAAGTADANVHLQPTNATVPPPPAPAPPPVLAPATQAAPPPGKQPATTAFDIRLDSLQQSVQQLTDVVSGVVSQLSTQDAHPVSTSSSPTAADLRLSTFEKNIQDLTDVVSRLATTKATASTAAPASDFGHYDAVSTQHDHDHPGNIAAHLVPYRARQWEGHDVHTPAACNRSFGSIGTCACPLVYFGRNTVQALTSSGSLLDSASKQTILQASVDHGHDPRILYSKTKRSAANARFGHDFDHIFKKAENYDAAMRQFKVACTSEHKRLAHNDPSRVLISSLKQSFAEMQTFKEVLAHKLPWTDAAAQLRVPFDMLLELRSQCDGDDDTRSTYFDVLAVMLLESLANQVRPFETDFGRALADDASRTALATLAKKVEELAQRKPPKLAPAAPADDDERAAAAAANALRRQQGRERKAAAIAGPAPPHANQYYQPPAMRPPPNAYYQPAPPHPPGPGGNQQPQPPG